MQTVFLRNTVREELADAQAGVEMLPFDLTRFYDQHPYDLSGGEQQLVALAKVLATKPELLLLDEPTKGLDPFFKITLAGIFKKLTDQRVTLFMVSHDVEFCAEYGDRCAMFFDGDVVSSGEAKAFFAGNSFYTTTANRIVRQWNDQLVTWEEVARWVEQNTTR